MRRDHLRANLYQRAIYSTTHWRLPILRCRFIRGRPPCLSVKATHSPMRTKKRTAAVHLDHISQSILILRGHKVLLDADLAQLYGVATKVLVQAVKRNIERFPEDFMLRLAAEEWQLLRSRIVTSNPSRGGRRYSPYAFTEQGVAMLSLAVRDWETIGKRAHSLKGASANMQAHPLSVAASALESAARAQSVQDLDGLVHQLKDRLNAVNAALAKVSYRRAPGRPRNRLGKQPQLS
jgi:hypothetical protein